MAAYSFVSNKPDLSMALNGILAGLVGITAGADVMTPVSAILVGLIAGGIVVASVIGAGIFFTPGRVAELLPHPGWIFAAWLVGGLLSLAGALANAELGAMFPRAGGDYVYLREAFHPLAGFLVGWRS